jgi:hypothetical protein
VWRLSSASWSAASALTGRASRPKHFRARAKWSTARARRRPPPTSTSRPRCLARLHVSNYSDAAGATLAQRSGIGVLRGTGRLAGQGAVEVDGARGRRVDAAGNAGHHARIPLDVLRDVTVALHARRLGDMRMIRAQDRQAVPVSPRVTIRWALSDGMNTAARLLRRAPRRPEQRHHACWTDERIREYLHVICVERSWCPTEREVVNLHLGDLYERVRRARGVDWWAKRMTRPGRSQHKRPRHRDPTTPRGTHPGQPTFASNARLVIAPAPPLRSPTLGAQPLRTFAGCHTISYGSREGHLASGPGSRQVDVGPDRRVV